MKLNNIEQIKKKNHTLIEGFNFESEKWEVIKFDLFPESEFYHYIKSTEGWVSLQEWQKKY